MSDSYFYRRSKHHEGFGDKSRVGREAVVTSPLGSRRGTAPSSQSGRGWWRSRWTVNMCVFRLPVRLVRCGQCGHRYGFSPVWVSMWRSRSCLLLRPWKRRPQTPQRSWSGGGKEHAEEPRAVNMAAAAANPASCLRPCNTKHVASVPCHLLISTSQKHKRGHNTQRVTKWKQRLNVAQPFRRPLTASTKDRRPSQYSSRHAYRL